MSLASASLVDGGGPTIHSSYAQEDGDADGAPHGRDGSVVAKLFGKNRPQVAVDEDDLQSHANGQEDSDDGESEDEDDESDVHANGKGLADADDDEEDDEYVLGSEEEDSGESDDEEADVNDLDDEETSMRSLLLPMATYAKQLLFLSEQDDDGEFDEQDAELWSSPEEKREWIDRYEATNRAYIDKYGCRIDAPAIPDMKKRLWRERNREAKYSLLLLVFAVAYLVRLLVGPVVLPPMDTNTTVASLSAEPPVVESVVSTPPPPAAAEWTSNGTPWWSVWTENLVVRVFAWPRSVATSLQSAISTKSRRKFEKAEHSVGDSIPDQHLESTQRPPVLPASKNEGAHSDTTNIDVQSSEEDNIVSQATTVEIVEEREVITIGDVVVEREVIATEATVSAQDAPMTSTHSDSEPTQASDVAQNQEYGVDEGSTRTDVEDRPSTESIGAGSSSYSEVSTPEVEDENPEVVPHDRNVQGDISSHAESLPVDDHDRVASLPMEDDAREKLADGSFQRCLEMFYMLVKMKHDTSVKTAAVSECDKAVEASVASTVVKQVKAYILRGDMKSLLQLFTEANEDYEAALASEGVPITLRSEIEIKISANRWIEHYHMKRFRELRKDCQQVRDSLPTASTQGSSDRLKVLAAEWLRAFRKETTVLKVLTKTRAWTLYRPTTQETNNA